MMRIAIILLIGFLMSLSTGCATLLRGDRQKVEFATDPAGATIDINGKIYKAPVTVALKRRDEYKITVSAPDYQAITFQLKANWDGASLGNIILPGGSVGFGWDTLNGADRSFGTLAEIKLNRATVATANETPEQRYSFHGVVLSKEEYDKAMHDEQDYHAGSGISP